MMMLRWAVALATVAAGLAGGPPAQAADPLVVCLEQDTPPYSFTHGPKTGGFDLAVSEAVARSLGRPLLVRWFEIETDEDSNPVVRQNALLSDGVCQLIAGYPLTVDALAKPAMDRGHPPDHDGARPGEKRRWVTLGTVAASRAYHFAPFTVVLGAAAAGRPIAGLGDLQTLRIGVYGGTLADTILMTWNKGQLIDRIRHATPGKEQLFERFEKGEFDATLIELNRFDAYRAAHPDTTLRASGYYFPVAGVNLGFIGLATEADLLAKVNGALADLLAKNALVPLAEAAGMTYVPPQEPEITHFALSDLLRQ